MLLGSSGSIHNEQRGSMIFVGIDWAERHHDVCVIDTDGQVLTKARIVEGLDGVARLHALIGKHAEDSNDVVVGVETDRRLLVEALVAGGYQVYAVNPFAASRYRDRHVTSGAKSDPGDAKVLPTWCAPTGTTIAEWQAIQHWRKQSRSWRVRISASSGHGSGTSMACAARCVSSIQAHCLPSAPTWTLVMPSPSLDMPVRRQPAEACASARSSGCCEAVAASVE